MQAERETGVFDEFDDEDKIFEDYPWLLFFSFLFVTDCLFISIYLWLFLLLYEGDIELTTVLILQYFFLKGILHIFNR